MPKFRPGKRVPSQDPSKERLFAQRHAELTDIAKRLEPHMGANAYDRATAWIVAGDEGSSAVAIWATMTGFSDVYPRSHQTPRDAGDLGRCIRLLAYIPEWRPRIAEMASCGPEWAAISGRWQELEDCYLAECGLFFEKNTNGDKTHELLSEVARAAEPIPTP